MTAKDGLHRVRDTLVDHGTAMESRDDGSWRGRCPRHGGQSKDSLSLRHIEPKAGDRCGRAQLRCFGGCDERDILADIGLDLADLYDEAPPKISGEVVREHAYIGANGRMLGVVRRTEPKSFRPATPTAAGWVAKSSDELKTTPYRLLAVVAAVEQGDPVYVVEGERDADVLASRGIAATCNAHGAGKWTVDHAQWLRGADVVVWQDCDEPGRNHAQQVVASLVGIARSVRVVQAKEGKDAGDHLSAGYGVEDAVPIELEPPTNHEANEANEVTKERQPAPMLHASALHGLLGEVVQRVEPATEASPAAMLSQLISYAGALLGDSVYTLAGGSPHPPRVWTLVVGPTSAGRKGESRARVRGFVTSSGSFDSYFVDEASGLSSGEGLLHRLRDDDSGGGKSAVVTETEFGRTLAASKREGNTISHVLRDLWDDGQAQSMTKGDPIKVTGAHLVVIGHVTPRELRLKLTEIDVAGGLANRFTYIWSHRTKLLPDQAEPPEMLDLEQQFHDTIGWARALGRRQIRRTTEANEYWRRIYHAVNEQEPDGILGELIARASAYTLRIALVYALMDKAVAIDVVHLRAALAVVAYSIASAKHVFGDTSDAGDLGRLSQSIKAAGDQGLTRSEISKLFSRNRSAEQINALVGELVDAGQIKEITEKAEGERGRPTIRAVWVDTNRDSVSIEALLDEPPPTNNESNAASPPPAEQRASGASCIGCGCSLPEGAHACADCFKAGRVA